MKIVEVAVARTGEVYLQSATEMERSDMLTDVIGTALIKFLQISLT